MSDLPVFLPSAMAAPGLDAWHRAAEPPELYELVQLLFADGKIRRGTWNGRIWWGYDERIRRSVALHPIAWRSPSAAVFRSPDHRAPRGDEEAAISSRRPAS